MKKIKNILAILSSITVISACAASAVYADEAVTEPTENEESVTDTDDLIAADAPGINIINVRTAAYIAYALAKDYEFIDDSFDYFDYNKDGKLTVRDAANIARDLANKSK